VAKVASCCNGKLETPTYHSSGTDVSSLTILDFCMHRGSNLEKQRHQLQGPAFLDLFRPLCAWTTCNPTACMLLLLHTRNRKKYTTLCTAARSEMSNIDEMRWTRNFLRFDIPQQEICNCNKTRSSLIPLFYDIRFSSLLR